MRRAIVRAPAAYQKMAKRLEKAKVRFRETREPERLPRGFETVAEPAIAAAVLRSRIGSKPIDLGKLASPRLVDDLVAFARQALPLLEWGWAAIVDER